MKTRIAAIGLAIMCVVLASLSCCPATDSIDEVYNTIVPTIVPTAVPATQAAIPSQVVSDVITPVSTLEPTPSSQVATEANVVRVVDGDTIKVDIGGEVYTLRYIGIDTPETVHPSKPVEWMGPEASEANRQLVEGQTVHLEKDVSETDRYGRLLRYVYLADGTFVNAELVRLGYAQSSTYPPDVKYQDLFLEMQQEAREAGRGLWATATAESVAEPTSAPQPTEVTEVVSTVRGDFIVPGTAFMDGRDLVDAGFGVSTIMLISIWDAVPRLGTVCQLEHGTKVDTLDVQFNEDEARYYIEVQNGTCRGWVYPDWFLSPEYHEPVGEEIWLHRIAVPTPLLEPTALPVCDCSGDVYNCGDFSTHTAAQACHDYCVAQGKGDVHELDADGDGSACESLP